MVDKKTTDETTRAVDGTEVVRLATSGANWKATLSSLFSAFVVGEPVSDSDTGTPYQVAFDSGGNLYFCYATDTWAKYTNVAPFGSQRRITQAGVRRITQAGVERVIQ